MGRGVGPGVVRAGVAGGQVEDVPGDDCVKVGDAAAVADGIGHQFRGDQERVCGRNAVGADARAREELGDPVAGGSRRGNSRPGTVPGVLRTGVLSAVAGAFMPSSPALDGGGHAPH